MAAPFLGVTDDGQWQAQPQPSLTLAPLVDRFHRGEFDLIALGRAVLADPDWAAKVAGGQLDGIRPYDKSADATWY